MEKDQQTPSVFQQELLDKANQLAQTNVVNMVAMLNKSLVPPMVSPLATAFSIINPFFAMIQSVNESMRRIVEPIQQIAKATQRLFAALQSASSILNAYRQMQENAQANIQKLVGFTKYWELTEVVPNCIDIIQGLSKRLHRYTVLKKARDGDRKAYNQIPTLFPIQFRHYKQVNQDTWSVADFSNLVMMKFMELLNRFRDLEEQSIDVLFAFLEKLFYALEDLFRKDARAHHLERLGRGGLNSVVIIHENDRYVLVPSLAFETGLTESKLRRWAQQELLPAKKLPYTFRSGHTKHIWHISLTPDLFDRLRELRDIPEKKSKLSVLGYLNRQEASKASGVPESTLKLWEKRGVVTPVRRGRKVLYTSVHLEQLATILDQKQSSPVFQASPQFAI